VLVQAIKSCWDIDDRNNIHPREPIEIPRTVDCFQSNLAKAPILGTPLSVIGSLPFYRGSFDMKLTALGTLANFVGATRHRRDFVFVAGGMSEKYFTKRCWMLLLLRFYASTHEKIYFSRSGCFLAFRNCSV
jgi:hypothetical protein